MIAAISRACRRILIVAASVGLAYMALQHIVDVSIAEDDAYARAAK